MVLDRRAGQRQPMVALQQPHRFRGGGALVLDRLRLVQHDVVEAMRLKAGDIPPQRPIRGQHHIHGSQIVGRRVPIRAREIQHAQPRRKTRRFADPVEDQRSRQHDQGRTRRSRRIHAARLQQREDHHGLAKAHVVGQAAAEAEVAEKAQPAKRLTLIVAKPADESHRRMLGLDAGEVLQPLARFDEAFVPIDRRLSDQQRLDQSCLRRTKAHAVAGGIGE